MTQVIKINEKNKDVHKHINFFNQNKNKGVWFVKYYADWCPHCTHMQSDWDQLEKHEILKNKNIHIAEVEESFFNKLNFKPDVIGFPTIKLYNNGNSKDFKGNRNTDNMLSFLKENHKDRKNYQSGGKINFKTFRKSKNTKKSAKRKNNKKQKSNKKQKTTKRQSRNILRNRKKNTNKKTSR